MVGPKWSALRRWAVLGGVSNLKCEVGGALHTSPSPKGVRPTTCLLWLRLCPCVRKRTVLAEYWNNALGDRSPSPAFHHSIVTPAGGGPLVPGSSRVVRARRASLRSSVRSKSPGPFQNGPGGPERRFPLSPEPPLLFLAGGCHQESHKLPISRLTLKPPRLEDRRSKRCRVEQREGEAFEVVRVEGEKASDSVAPHGSDKPGIVRPQAPDFQGPDQGVPVREQLLTVR